MVYGRLLARLVKMSRKIMGDNLVGVYLHGSAVMGCFHPEKSDLDLIFVVKHGIPDMEKKEFMNGVVRLNQEAPAKGIELSIVKREFCNPFVYPTPYELHFSAAHLDWWSKAPEDYIERMKGTDKDLAAHFTILSQYGVILYGECIDKVFGPVPRTAYIDSIWADVENACTDILTNPVYITLNLCRVMAYLEDNLILSKKAGGEWGIRVLPQKFHALIREALLCYSTGKEMTADAAAALEFAKEMTARIKARGIFAIKFQGNAD